MENQEKKQDVDTELTEIKLEENKELLEEKKIKNEMLRADMFRHYVETYMKAIGAIGLTVTTITQAIITIMKMTHHHTARVMMSASGGGMGSAGHGDMAMAAAPMVEKAEELFSLPQYGLFGLMVMFAVMMFFKKKKKEEKNDTEVK